MFQPIIQGDRLHVRFQPPFDLAAYDLFLKCKQLPESEITLDADGLASGLTAPARFAALLGIEPPKIQGQTSPLFGALLPEFQELEHQREILKLALDAKRYAVWSDVGTGKTLIELEFARQVTLMTGGRVLIITLNEIVDQMIGEARKFYGDTLQPVRLHSREEMRQWCKGEGNGQVAITNYEKMNPDDNGQVVNEMRHLAGLVCDESSRLRGGGGKQKWALIKSSKGIPYKLSCTATPAPNDVIEFASQASFLERMRSDNEIIWTFFQRDPVTQEWTVKRHARKAFFEWMAAWSIYLRDPRRYGWSSNIELPPVPEVSHHTLTITPAQMEAARDFNTTNSGQMAMFTGASQGIVGRSKLSQIAKGFVYEGEQKQARRIESVKPDFVARLIQEDAHLNPLVWTVFDEESKLIAEALRAGGFNNFQVLSGDTPKVKRAPMIESYRRGETPVLISKTKLLGYGMNFQHCGSMIFSGWDDSFEALYQAIGRAVRYGQKQRVRVHLPFIEELEGEVLKNVLRKASQFEQLVSEQEQAYIAAMKRLRLLEGK